MLHVLAIYSLVLIETLVLCSTVTADLHISRMEYAPIYVHDIKCGR